MTELAKQPVSQVVDPDALETLTTETAAPNRTVCFIDRCQDIVDADGRVQVSETESRQSHSDSSASSR